jgi:hypothetical protein
MGWRFWTPEKSEAQKNLDALQQDTTKRSSKMTDLDLDAIEAEIFVTLTQTPADRAPGSPLACLNEGGPVHVGDRVQLSTSFTVQETSIVSITRDGTPCTTLDFDEHANIVLADDADLSDVYRTSILQDPGTDETAGEIRFLLQVHTAEQRDKDVYVTGRATGDLAPGAEAVVVPWTDPAKRFATVKRVDRLPEDRVGLLLAKKNTTTLEYGDEIQHF